MTLRDRSHDGRRSGSPDVAWSAPHLAGAPTLALSSPDFEHEGMIPAVHAAVRAGGQNLSPALTWSPPPSGTVQLLLVIEDPDASTPRPFIHCVALLDTSVASLGHGALDAGHPAGGVSLLRSGIGRGYLGPAPPKSHGPHRYVFQLFALAAPVGLAGAALDSARPRDVLAAARDVLAGGRLDGFYQRGLA